MCAIPLSPSFLPPSTLPVERMIWHDTDISVSPLVGFCSTVSETTHKFLLIRVSIEALQYTLVQSLSLTYLYLWFLLVNHPNPSTCLEEKGQQDLNQPLKCLVTVGEKETLIPSNNISHIWALRISAEHIPAAPRYSTMQIPNCCLVSVLAALAFVLDRDF